MTEHTETGRWITHHGGNAPSSLLGKRVQVRCLCGDTTEMEITHREVSPPPGQSTAWNWRTLGWARVGVHSVCEYRLPKPTGSAMDLLKSIVKDPKPAGIETTERERELNDG